MFDPGEVLYIYESAAGVGICVLRVIVSINCQMLRENHSYYNTKLIHNIFIRKAGITVLFEQNLYWSSIPLAYLRYILLVEHLYQYYLKFMFEILCKKIARCFSRCLSHCLIYLWCL